MHKASPSTAVPVRGRAATLAPSPHPGPHPRAAPKAPFFVGKLRVKVLPSLVFFVDGVAVGRQTGLEGLLPPAAARGVMRGGGGGGGQAAIEDFPTSALWRALKSSGVLGAAQRERADSDSGEEGGEEEEEDEELRAALARLGASKPAQADALEKPLREAKPQPPPTEEQARASLGAALAKWGREEGE